MYNVYCTHSPYNIISPITNTSIAILSHESYTSAQIFGCCEDREREMGLGHRPVVVGERHMNDAVSITRESATSLFANDTKSGRHSEGSCLEQIPINMSSGLELDNHFKTRLSRRANKHVSRVPDNIKENVLSHLLFPLHPLSS